jgi:glycerol-3-phosphate dehydrogenase (NAD(P)+)
VRLAIIGGGSWGTALAIVLAPKCSSIRLWVHEADLASRMQASRENDVFLPGCVLPPAVGVSSELGEALQDAEIVLGAMPSHHARRVYSAVLPHVAAGAIIVSATKGLENNSLLRVSQVIREVAGNRAAAVLSGPTFAREVARGEPALMVVASEYPGVAEQVQRQFSSARFRLYTNSDVTGVELGAALKNVIAIAAGVCQGLGLGSNIRAALITRGLAEISRLAVKMGGDPRTLAGLAGLGDLVLTCTGELSRNRQVGIQLASGRPIAEITGSMRMVAEGVETCEAAVRLGSNFGVDLPIIQQMHAVIHGRKTAPDALKELMERSLKGE